MNHRVFLATIAVLALIALVSLSTAFSLFPPLYSPAYAQTDPFIAFGPAKSVARTNSSTGVL